MHLRLRGYRAFWFCIAVAGLAMAANSFAAEATSQTNRVLHLQFQTNSVGETIVHYGEKIPTAKTNVPNVLNFTKLAGQNHGAEVSIIPAESITQVTSEQFPGWVADVPPQHSAIFSLDYQDRRLDLQTSDLNPESIHLTFPDGAKVEMEGHSDGRMELMDDGTYAFYGLGKLTGVTADGAEARFAYVFPPLMGGRLKTPAANNPNGRFSRASPINQLTFVGQIDSGVSARLGKDLVQLEVGTPKTIRAENGGRLVAQLNPQTHTLDWEVQRGVFRINVETFRCWKALGAAGQSAAMQWDTNGVLVELKNKNGTNAFQKHILISLNPTLNVAVGESATFQYGRTSDCSTFVATAYGGETVMYNAESDRYVRLDQGNMNFISGSPESMPASQRTFTPVRLVWNTMEKVEFKSATESIAVERAGHEIFQADATTQLDLNYYGPERLVVRVEAGAAAITPNFMPNVTVEVVEGSAVTFGYDPAADLFRIESDPDNLSSIAIRTASRFYPRIMSGSRITFVVNRSPFIDGGGDLIFTEIAGAGDVNVIGKQPPFRPLPTGPPVIDSGRVDQPPVTTLE